LELISKFKLGQEIHFFGGWFLFNIRKEELLDWNVVGQISQDRFVQGHLHDLSNSLFGKNERKRTEENGIRRTRKKWNKEEKKKKRLSKKTQIHLDDQSSW
jgi:hypothetical protein